MPNRKTPAGLSPESTLSELWRRVVVTEREVARMLSLPISTWQLLKRRSAPPVLHLGKHNRYLVGDLRIWLEAQRRVEPRPGSP